MVADYELSMVVKSASFVWGTIKWTDCINHQLDNVLWMAEMLAICVILYSSHTTFIFYDYTPKQNLANCEWDSSANFY